MKLKKLAIVAALVVVAAGTLTACTSAATPSGMCGWIVGDGQNGHDRKTKQIVYENENPDVDANSEEAHYVPCGARNFIITDGSTKDLKGKPLGDQTTPDTATTKTNTPVKVQLAAYWELNQSKSALTEFQSVCNKYDCYTKNTNAGSSNFATTGWNKMLQEDFAPSIQSALDTAMKQMPDEIWENQDPVLYQQLSKLLAADFMEQVRVPTGSNIDLFCGSGNSGWDIAHKKFTCTNVRFSVTKVESASKSTQTAATAKSQTQINTDANSARYNSKFPLYGPLTNYWLGVQDSVKSCPKGSTCNFYLDKSGMTGQ